MLQITKSRQATVQGLLRKPEKLYCFRGIKALFFGQRKISKDGWSPQ
jgi:hypothetical protein